MATSNSFQTVQIETMMMPASGTKGNETKRIRKENWNWNWTWSWRMTPVWPESVWTGLDVGTNDCTLNGKRPSRKTRCIPGPIMIITIIIGLIRGGIIIPRREPVCGGGGDCKKETTTRGFPNRNRSSAEKGERSCKKIPTSTPLQSRTQVHLHLEEFTHKNSC